MRPNVLRWEVPEALIRFKAERSENAKLVWLQIYQNAGGELGPVTLNWTDLAVGLGMSEWSVRRGVDRLVEIGLAKWEGRERCASRLWLVDPQTLISAEMERTAEPVELWLEPDSIDVPAGLASHADLIDSALLGSELQAFGQLQPIVVRPAGSGRYELLAGDRVLQATRAAELRTVRAWVVSAEPERAAELVIALERQGAGVGPVARARALEILAAADGSASAVAERVGLAREAVEDSLALLSLPVAWQKRIARGELPEASARALATAAGDAKLEAAIDGRLDWLERPVAVFDVEQAVDFAIEDLSRPVAGSFLRRGGDGTPRAVLLSAEDLDRDDLDVREVPFAGRWEARAFNVELWETLQAAREAESPDAVASRSRPSTFAGEWPVSQ